MRAILLTLCAVALLAAGCGGSSTKSSADHVRADPVHQFGFQNVAPIVRASVVQKLGSRFTDTMDAVSAKLTQQAIVAMNKAVIVDKQQPAAVARQFLQANGLS